MWCQPLLHLDWNLCAVSLPDHGPQFCLVGPSLHSFLLCPSVVTHACIPWRYDTPTSITLPLRFARTRISPPSNRSSAYRSDLVFVKHKPGSTASRCKETAAGRLVVLKGGWGNRLVGRSDECVGDAGRPVNQTFSRPGFRFRYSLLL